MEPMEQFGSPPKKKPSPKLRHLPNVSPCGNKKHTSVWESVQMVSSASKSAQERVGKSKKNPKVCGSMKSINLLYLRVFSSVAAAPTGSTNPSQDKKRKKTSSWFSHMAELVRKLRGFFQGHLFSISMRVKSPTRRHGVSFGAMALFRRDKVHHGQLLPRKMHEVIRSLLWPISTQVSGHKCPTRQNASRHPKIPLRMKTATCLTQILNVPGVIMETQVFQNKLPLLKGSVKGTQKFLVGKIL